MGRYIAIDVGAESGRVIIGDLTDGKLTLETVHRFPNGGVEVKGHVYWDALNIFREIKVGLGKAVVEYGSEFSGLAVDPGFPSSEGIYLQLRSAIGHLNEAWAAEAAAAALFGLADTLEWEYIVDVARWTYDESRHCLMRYQRLLDWGYESEMLPMGDYIYTTANEYGPLYMLGMLHHFETKFIHRGRERIETFTSYNDDDSRHDYKFDWADETFHAEYGRRWIEKLLAQPDMPAENVDELRQQCEEYLQVTIASATQAEQDRIVAIAQELIAKAEARESAR